MRDALLGRDSKDADFLVPAIDIAGLRAALEPHGRTEELVVAGRPVGVRFFPASREIRSLARAGIELAPPRREVSPGRRESWPETNTSPFALIACEYGAPWNGAGAFSVRTTSLLTSTPYG